jgi:aryl-alcohol dehydrogenase-like predicted oxidoreductase
VRARELAAQKGCTPTQIALAWLMNQPFPCIPLTGTVRIDHLTENLGAAAVTLTETEVDELAYHAN